MIRINLAPEEEIEDRYFFIPDILVLVTVTGLCSIFVWLYFQSVQKQVDFLVKERDGFNESYALLADDENKYLTFNKSAEELNQRLESLKAITSSKVLKYRPVVLLEHLQSLKPNGVWVSEVVMGDRTTMHHFKEYDLNISDELLETPEQKAEYRGRMNSVYIAGRAFDNVLLAEYLTALRTTQIQDVDRGDLRTQLYFDLIDLQKSTMPKEISKKRLSNNESSATDRFAAVVSFEVRLLFRDRGEKKKKEIEGAKVPGRNGIIPTSVLPPVAELPGVSNLVSQGAN